MSPRGHSAGTLAAFAFPFEQAVWPSNVLPWMSTAVHGLFRGDGDVTHACPHCGGAILVQIVIPPPDKSGANPSAIVVQNGQIAHDLTEGFSSEAPKDQKRYNKGYLQDFLTFWSVYPRKRAKGVAYKAWSKAVQRLVQNTGANRTDAIVQILQGAIRYRDDQNREDGFTQHAATWLNGDGWEDEPLPSRLKPQTHQRPDPPRPYDPVMAELQIERARRGD